VTSRRGFLGAIAAALVLDPERALWVPGAKKIFLPPARAGLLVPVEVARAALFNVGDVVTFGNDPQRFVCMIPGDPTGLGSTFAFLSGRGLPWGTRFPDKIASGWQPSGRFRFNEPPGVVDASEPQLRRAIARRDPFAKGTITLTPLAKGNTKPC